LNLIGFGTNSGPLRSCAATAGGKRPADTALAAGLAEDAAGSSSSADATAEQRLRRIAPAIEPMAVVPTRATGEQPEDRGKRASPGGSTSMPQLRGAI
jgi:hypothetical protein